MFDRSYISGGQITAVEARKRIEYKHGYALDGSIHKALNNTNIFEVVDEGPPKLFSITEYGSLILGETITNLDPNEIISIKRAFLANIQESSDS